MNLSEEESRTRDADREDYEDHQRVDDIDHAEEVPLVVDQVRRGLPGGCIAMGISA